MLRGYRRHKRTSKLEINVTFHVYEPSYKGWQKCIHILRNVVCYFSKLNWITVAMCSRTFAQKMALINWMLASPCDSRDSQRKWRKHGCRSRSARPFLSGIWNSRALWNYNDNGGVTWVCNRTSTCLTIARIRGKFETQDTVWSAQGKVREANKSCFFC